MKTIVVSGAHSGIGKTSLCCAILDLFPNAVQVKIGHSKAKTGKNGFYYGAGTPAELILQNHKGVDYLIIESNSILQEISAELVVYLHGDNPKPSATIARKVADITRGMPLTEENVVKIAKRLDCDKSIIRKVAWLAGARPSPVTGLILAGGKSVRMGTDKAFLTINNTTMVQRLQQQLQKHCDQVMIVAGKNKLDKFANTETIADRIPGEGPLMGVYSGLLESPHEINIIVSCDIPQIDPAVLSLMLSCIDDHDIVIPSLKTQGDQPLCGVYHRRIYPVINDLLKHGCRKMRDLLQSCNSLRLSVDDESWYFNINTPEEFKNYFKEANIGMLE